MANVELYQGDEICFRKFLGKTYQFSITKLTKIFKE